MNIIIDPNDENFNGEVNIDEAKITCNPKIPLYTTDLVTCVGLAIIEKKDKRNLKRGLAQIHYCPDVLTHCTEDRDEYTMVPTKEECRKVKDGLDEFISHFKDPRAILIYNNFNYYNHLKSIW